ncbi:MAG: septal ring lytic transglycosylase RlpA family protein [Ignavibacteriae bacterium]|nr:septal ring lytic transglycosylase RlpA family protein [Ignavibacteriota bacterium]
MNKLFVSLSIITIILLSGCSASMRFSSKTSVPSGNSPSHISSKVTKGETGSLFSNDNENQSKQPLNMGESNSIELRGKASYYGDEFQGRMTSNGEIYVRDKFTAAHRSLPFGTLLLVTNLKNNLSVVVKVNDRGPFKPTRILDLSYAAAEELNMIRDGVTEVKIAVIE